MAQALSAEIREKNGPGQIANLTAAGYMSPQDASFTGQGFACANCDWYAYAKGSCTQLSIRANVETNGCCNKFTYHGVHT